MKKYTLFLLLFVNTLLIAQEKTFETQVQEISKKIEEITKKEKELLKKKVKSIQLKEDKQLISKENAQKLKIEAAEFHANAIEEKVEKIQEKLEKLVEDMANGKIKDSNSEKIHLTIDDNVLEIKVSKKEKKKPKRPKTKRTTSQFVLAYGINNLVNDQQIKSLDNSEYKLWKSHFYELGWTFKTRLSENASKVYFKYGLSFLWNNLRAKNNQYLTTSGSTTLLQTHSQNLSESRFRNTQLIIPTHFEFDFSKNYKNKEGYKRDRSHKSVRLGLGAYGGIKLGSRQILKYRNETNHKVKEVQKGDFNTSNFTYGLSSYLAYKSIGLYAKYDLSPLFKDTESRNISFGIRCDFN